MAKFLTTQATSYHLEKIITQAVDKLVIVSPYLRISPVFADRLRDADRRGVKTMLVYQEEKLKPQERKLLGGFSKLSLFSHLNLHAKCYFNEHEMIIGSMNFYEFSQVNNREMGVLFKADEPAYADAVKEVDSILASANRVTLPKPSDREQQRASAGQSRPGSSGVARAFKGTCIRCRGTAATSR